MRRPEVMDHHSDGREWWEPVEREGCLLWRAWLGGVCVEHVALNRARELVRQKVERGQ